jgi:uncharacterized protein YprB with RNaseH-like and TPR domain
MNRFLFNSLRKCSKVLQHNTRQFAITTRRPKRAFKWENLADKCLVFIDMEMTGLDVNKDIILEVNGLFCDMVG